LNLGKGLKPWKKGQDDLGKSGNGKYQPWSNPE